VVHEITDDGSYISPNGKNVASETPAPQKSTTKTKVPVVSCELVSVPDKVNFFGRTNGAIFGVCSNFQKSVVPRDRLGDSRGSLDWEPDVGPPGMV
jgi:hypothetical protein